MKLYSFLFMVILLFALSANAGVILDRIKDDKESIKNLLNEENVKMNIYVGGSYSNSVDLYYNKKDTKTKKEVIIYVHGGAWIFGNKYEFSKIGSFLCKEGYVAVLPNYILYPLGKIDDMVDDVYKTIEWTYKNIAKYGGDKTKITLVGHSAGAHLAALTTIKSHLKMENLYKNLNPLPALKKMVLFNGPYDFDDYDVLTKFLVKSDIDNGIAETIVKILFHSDDVSPTDIVRSLKSKSVGDFGVPKIVFFYTDEDQLVPESAADKLMKELRRVTSSTEIKYIFNKGNHYDHTTVIDGARTGDEELSQYFMEIIKS